MSVLSAVYGRVALLRRRAYQRPGRQRRLHAPVISIGNIALGGSGKTPLVAAIAGLLGEAGERPAIVSRGYGRKRAADGALVVSDGQRLLVADARMSGDEPQMLARMLPGVRVVVSPDRYLGGRLAESRLGATCILLDDGFQHLQLARDIDLVIVSPGDLNDAVVPSGRLREPLHSAAAADAILVPGSEEEAERVAAAVGRQGAFRLEARFDPPRLLGPGRAALPIQPCGVVAVAGIARPERFFSALAVTGWDVRRSVVHRDHHWFTAADVAAAERLAREVGAELVITTEKDAVRLEPFVARGTAATWAVLPMHVAVEPAERFREWLLARLGEARR